jgi:succinate dehydrogenase / fumarate reductase cytochrome b subunit
MCISWLRSSIGKKALMAASGLALIGFVVMHLLGNLLIYRGPDALNAYAKKLRDLGPMLWVARGGLLLALIAHVVTSIQLSIENRKARPVRYAVQRSAETTVAAKTMLLSGLLLLVYLVYHLLHFTFRVAHHEISHAVDPFGRQDVYAMAVQSFAHPAIVLAYLAGVAVVCLHLSHGLASAFQTLGLNNERTLLILTGLSRLFAALVFLGYASIPLAVLLGLIGHA